MTLASLPARKTVAMVAAIVGTLAAFFAITSLLGQPARLVDLVGLFASAFTAGAGLVVAIRRDP